MPFRAWVLIAALGCLTPHYGSAQETADAPLENQPIANQGNEEGEGASQQEPAPDQDGTEALIPGLESIEAAIRDLEAKISTSPGHEEQDRARRDLEAQEDMAQWAKLMFFAAIASVVLTALGVWLIWGTLKHTAAMARDTDTTARAAVGAVKQAKIANETAKATVFITREIGEVQARAYLSIKKVAFGVSSSGSFMAGVIVENIGKSPARHCHFVCQIIFQSPDETGFYKQVTQFTSPWPLGDIQAGKESYLKDAIQFDRIKIPYKAAESDEKNIVMAIRIGVFAVDVFGKEIECLEGMIFAVGLMMEVNFVQEWTSIPMDVFGGEAEMRGRAWTGQYASKKPNQHA